MAENRMEKINWLTSRIRALLHRVSRGVNRDALISSSELVQIHEDTQEIDDLVYIERRSRGEFKDQDGEAPMMPRANPPGTASGQVLNEKAARRSFGRGVVVPKADSAGRIPMVTEEAENKAASARIQRDKKAEYNARRRASRKAKAKKIRAAKKGK